MKRIDFASSRPFTLGVELEFQLLDSRSLDLVPAAPAILRRGGWLESKRVAPEFLRSIIEIQTGICGSVDEVAEDLAETIQMVEQVAREDEVVLYSASLHPFAIPEKQQLSNGERYQRIMNELQYVGRQFISQGLHVHVGVSDPETAIRLCNVLQVYLPLLLALSGSSPYFRGQDTGFSSYRTKLFEALPLAGIAGYIGSWKEYEEEIGMLRERGIILQIRDLWWDVRPSPGFGTVEVRTCDIPCRFQEVLGLTAIIQALAAAVSEGLVRSRRVSLQLLRYNKWQAARHGLEGRFCDPLTLLQGGVDSLADAVHRLLEVLAPYFRRFASTDHLDAIDTILAEGTGAARQRRLMAAGGSFRDMITTLQENYWS